MERSQRIGLRQARKTIANIERRKEQGKERPTDPELLESTKRALAKWALKGTEEK